MSQQPMTWSGMKVSVASIFVGAVLGFGAGFLFHHLTGVWHVGWLGILGMCLGAMAGAFVGRMMEKAE